MDSETRTALPGHGRFVGVAGLMLLTVPVVAFVYATLAGVS